MNKSPAPQVPIIGNTGDADFQSLEKNAARKGVRRRVWRRLLVVVTVLVLLPVALLTLEKWRGRQAWLSYKAELDAKGEVLDWRAFFPPPVSDEQNFAATPLLREIFTAEAANRAAVRWGSTNAIVPRINRVRLELGGENVAKLPSRSDLLQNKLADLAGWARHFAGNTNYFARGASTLDDAHIVLAALAIFDSELAELQAAASRPQSRYDINYDVENPFDILLPHLGRLRSVQQVLMLRATARLADGQADAALADVKLMLRLADSIKTDSIVTSHMVRITLLQEALQVVQEGLARDAWNRAQYAEIERMLAGANPLADLTAVMRAERAGGLSCLDAFKRMPASAAAAWFKLMNVEVDSLPAVWVLRAEVDFNKETYARMMQQYFIDGLGLAKNRLYPRIIENVDKEWAHVGESLTARRRYLFTAQMLPALQQVIQRSARVQTAVGQTRVACALEHYRRLNGHKPPQYPEKLDQLAPEFLPALPRDLVPGGPLVYRREGDAGYILYAPGWNGTDDGGTVALNNQIPPRIDLAKGDWVWHWPPHAPEAAIPRITRVVVEGERAVVEGRGGKRGFVECGIPGEGLAIESSLPDGEDFTALVVPANDGLGIAAQKAAFGIPAGAAVSSKQLGNRQLANGRIVFRQGERSPEPDGSYLIADFHPTNGDTVPIFVRVRPANRKPSASSTSGPKSRVDRVVDTERGKLVEGWGSYGEKIEIVYGPDGKIVRSDFPHEGPFTAIMERAVDGGIDILVKQQARLIDIRNAGFVHGQWVFRKGTLSPEADGSYRLGEYRPDNGNPWPVAVKLISGAAQEESL